MMSDVPARPCVPQRREHPPPVHGDVTGGNLVEGGVHVCLLQGLPRRVNHVLGYAVQNEDCSLEEYW